MQTSTKDELLNVENKQPKKLSKVRGVFSFILKMLLVTALVILLFVTVASNNGTGYEGTVHLTSTRFLVPGHPCAGIYCVFDADISFNPFLYPISHATGNGRISGTSSYVYYPTSEQGYRVYSKEIEEQMVGGLVWSELIKNLPYLFIVSLIIGFVVIIIIQSIKNKIVGIRKATKSQFKQGDAWSTH